MISGFSRAAERVSRALSLTAFGGVLTAAFFLPSKVDHHPAAALNDPRVVRSVVSGQTAPREIDALSETGSAALTRKQPRAVATAPPPPPRELPITTPVSVDKAAEPQKAETPPPAQTASAQSPSPPAEMQWSTAEVEFAKAECSRLIGSLKIDWTELPPTRQRTCGAPAPITLRSIGNTSVAFEPAAVTNCNTAAAFSNWITEIQITAQKLLSSKIVKLVVADSYQCRNRNGATSAPLSEHALANAVDISAFGLADGRVIHVVQTWGMTKRDSAKLAAPITKTEKSIAPAQSGRAPAIVHPIAPSGQEAPQEMAQPAPPEQTFLRSAHAAACLIFGTVLGPEANDFHRDHFHLDIKARKTKSFCE